MVYESKQAKAKLAKANCLLSGVYQNPNQTRDLLDCSGVVGLMMSHDEL